MNISTCADPNTPSLSVYFKKDVGEWMCRAVEVELVSRATAMGLRLMKDAQIGRYATIDKEGFVCFGLLEFTASKNAKDLRMKLLQDMVLFLTMTPKIEKILEQKGNQLKYKYNTEYRPYCLGKLPIDWTVC